MRTMRAPYTFTVEIAATSYSNEDQVQHEESAA